MAHSRITHGFANFFSTSEEMLTTSYDQKCFEELSEDIKNNKINRSRLMAECAKIKNNTSYESVKCNSKGSTRENLAKFLCSFHTFATTYQVPTATTPPIPTALSSSVHKLTTVANVNKFKNKLKKRISPVPTPTNLDLLKKDYESEMMKPGNYGTHSELNALANIYEVNIRVHVVHERDDGGLIDYWQDVPNHETGYTQTIYLKRVNQNHYHAYVPTNGEMIDTNVSSDGACMFRAFLYAYTLTIIKDTNDYIKDFLDGVLGFKSGRINDFHFKRGERAVKAIRERVVEYNINNWNVEMCLNFLSERGVNVSDEELERCYS